MFLRVYLRIQNTVSELETDTGIRKAMVVPVNRIEIKNIFFRRISHHIVKSQTKQQKIVAKTLAVNIPGINPVIHLFTSFSEIVGGNKVPVISYLNNLSGIHYNSGRKC